MGRTIGKAVATAIAIAGLAAAPVQGETLRVGVPAVTGYTYLATEVALQHGFFKANHIDVNVSVFEGGAKIQQAIFADGIDIAVAGGTDFAFIAKGVPEIAVAAMAGPPLALGVIVPYDSSMTKADDLRGKKIGITTVGSLSEWLMRRLEKEKGWGANGLTMVALGGSAVAGLGALSTGQIDALFTQSALGFQLELSKRGRLLFPTSDIVQKFLVYAIYATTKTVQDHPDALRRFLKGWFENVADMRANKAKTVETLRSLTKFDPEVQSREYDLVTPMFSTDGRFDPQALDALAESFVETNMMATKPDMSKLYTEAYLPGR